MKGLLIKDYKLLMLQKKTFLLMLLIHLLCGTYGKYNLVL